MVFAKLDKINRKEKINSNDTYTFEIQSIQLCLQKNIKCQDKKLLQ